jgi:hypothetical protein
MRDLKMFGSESVAFYLFGHECDFQSEIDNIYDELSTIRDLSSLLPSLELD